MAAAQQPQRRAADRRGDGASDRDRLLRIAFTFILVVTAGALGWWLWQRMMGGATREAEPAWLRDSDRLVYTLRGADTGDLWTVSLSNGGAEPLAALPSHDGHGVFSPDGRRLAFESDRNGNFDIWISEANGEGPRAVTDHPAQDRSPSWSTDNRHIVFASSRDGKGTDIYRINADGTGLERLTTDGASSSPEFSPDGAHIAYTSGRDLYVLNLKTRQSRRLTYEPLNGLHPSWSPNGRQLAFMSWRNGRAEVFTARADGTDQQLLVSMPTGDAVDPAWSPNGRYIAFVHRPGGAEENSSELIYVVDVETKRLTRVSR